MYHASCIIHLFDFIQHERKNAMTATTGAECVVGTLIGEGVQRLFTLSGNQIMSIYDATIGRDIELIHVRHEAAAVHMADGWGRLTGDPGIALVTAGPGHVNALSALYVARMAESPLLLLSGHAPLSQLGRGAFQEIDQVAMAKPVAKAAWRVEDPGQLGAEIVRAFQLARAGRPGPVHLSIPDDVLKSKVVKQNVVRGDSIHVPSESVDSGFVDQALTLLERAERPLILAGPAMARGIRWEAVTKLSEKTGVPALPMMSPRGVNDPSLHDAVNCLAVADLILLAGKKLDFSLRFGECPPFSTDCRYIQIEVDDSELRDDERILLQAHADPNTIVQQLVSNIQDSKSHEQWREKVEESRRKIPLEWESLRKEDHHQIHPLRVCEALQPFLNEGGIFISDGGEVGQWAQAGLEASTRLINGPSGAIGSVIPMAIGAKCIHPDRTVFALLGDGTFGFHAMEFDTAIRYDLPIVAIVGNDARWNAEHQIQINTYGLNRAVGCDLLPSRYDQVVQALGGYGIYVEDPADLTDAITQAVDSGLPACINVAIDGVGAPSLLR